MRIRNNSTEKLSLAELSERFTPEECARLEALRQRLRTLPVSVELALNPRRLQFARWLVEQGKLRETL